MRLDSMTRYPRQMMLGAISDDDLIYDMGQDIARELKTLGIHLNFAPVVDVNNNPDNPVINSRSFGEMRNNVARKAMLYMKGMQDAGIMAVAKHFPGHGDTDTDSHYGLPVVHQSRSRLDSIELFPFRALISGGVSGVMVAHLNVLSLDTTPNLPATLSPLIVDSLLQKQMKFKGLVFTDAMGMKGITDVYKPEEANIKAVEAGNDILLMPEDEEETIDDLAKMIKKGEMDESEIDLHCRKILQAKEWAVLPTLKNTKLPPAALVDSLNSPYFDLMHRKLVEKAITLVDDKKKLIPFLRLDTCRFAVVSLGGQPDNKYQRTLTRYAKMSRFYFSGQETSDNIADVLDSLRHFNLVFLSIHSDDIRVRRNFGVSDRLMELADAILYNYPVVLNAFANPYLLRHLNYLDRNLALMVSYEDDSITQSVSAQMLFGAFGTEGSLPVSINDHYPAGTGVITHGDLRLQYTSPLEAGMNADMLGKIDSLAEDAIAQKATPGCEILVARNGKVFWQKSYGYQDYRKTRPVKNTDLYDLASVTKITATVPSLMFLDENGLIDIDKPLSTYLPELDTTNKAKLKIRDILLHQAGLEAWIPFYMSALQPVYPDQDFSSNKYSETYPIQIGKNYYVNKHLKFVAGSFSLAPSDSFPIQVANGLYMSRSWVDSIFYMIYRSKVSGERKYLYSDLGFYLFFRMIERMSNKPFAEYVDSMFYRPLGAYTLGYNPLHKFSADNIAPTEDDLIFRRQIIRGFVHDPGAAMLGGVSGHAGLFSSANDLAKMMQMYLNGGTYGGHRFLQQDEIDKFTSSMDGDNGNRRGLGFDKPQLDTTRSGGPTCKGISLSSYGHTGFTGTMVWMDPSTGLLYIFLSNRVYPDAMNKKLIQMDVRTNIQRAIYDAMLTSNP